MVFKKGDIAWNKGKKGRQEYHNITGLASFGSIPWNKGKKGVMPTPWNKGKKLSPEHINKLILNHKGMLGKKHSIEVCEKIRKANLGKHLSEEITRKMSKTMKKNYTKERKQKIGLEHTGSKCAFWKGGIYNHPYPEYFSKELKNKIRKRDNFMCQVCFKKGLHVHHIDYIKDNCDNKNLITLCNPCHARTNGDREFSKYYLQKIMEVRYAKEN